MAGNQIDVARIVSAYTDIRDEMGKLQHLPAVAQGTTMIQMLHQIENRLANMETRFANVEDTQRRLIRDVQEINPRLDAMEARQDARRLAR
jgi:chromosome segregation ATPase